jgi:hypothetical protein
LKEPTLWLKVHKNISLYKQLEVKDTPNLLWVGGELR